MTRIHSAPGRPRFVWTLLDVDRCFFSGERLVQQNITLGLLGSVTDRYTAEARVARKSGVTYAPFGMLIQMARELDCLMADLSGFTVEGEERASAVLIDEEIVPWEEFAPVADRAMPAFGMLEGDDPEGDDADVSEEVWEVTFRPHSWMENEDGETSLAYLALIADARGRIRGFDLSMGKPTAGSLREMIRSTVATEKKRGRGAGYPARIIAKIDAEGASSLGELLSESGVSVEAGETPMAEEAMGQMLSATGATIGEPYFSRYTPEEIIEFFKAGADFLKAQAWTEMMPGEIASFRRPSGSHVYGTLVGHLSQEFGILLFDEWLHLCAFVQHGLLPGDNLTALFEAIGGVESVSLHLTEVLHPEDQEMIERLDIPPSMGDSYFLPTRATDDGLATPTHPPGELTAILRATVELAEACRNEDTILVAEVTPSERNDFIDLVRCPSLGEESLQEDTKYFRVRFKATKDIGKRLKKGDDVELDVRGEWSIDDVAETLFRTFRLKPRRFGLKLGECWLWSDRSEDGYPEPFVGNLAGVKELSLAFSRNAVPISVMPVVGRAAPGEVRVNRKAQG